MTAFRSAPRVQAPGFHRSRVGALVVTAVNDGFARRPVAGFVRNADEGAVAAALRDAFLPEDAVPIPFTTLVVEAADRLVLIDAGNGDSGAPTSGAWMANFHAAGYRAEDVDLVLVSHFHPDHVNGLRLSDGTPVFPRARIRAPRAEWDYWMDDSRMADAPDAAAPAFRNARRVFGPMRDGTEAPLDLFEPGEEAAPGCVAVAAPGHTPGHTAFRIASQGETLLALSDTTNHPALFARNPGWHAVFDMDPHEAEATRRRLLGEAAASRTRVALYHAPFPATGHVARAGDGFAFVPAQWSHLV